MTETNSLSLQGGGLRLAMLMLIVWGSNNYSSVKINMLLIINYITLTLIKSNMKLLFLS